jgi:hypothetical protein
MKSKSVQLRSMNVRLSVRTLNDLEKFLSGQEQSGDRAARKNAAALLRRLDRAPRSRAR